MLSRPVRLSAGQEFHLRHCAHCGRAAQRAKSFESGLRKALDIPVPVGIEGRVLHRRDIRQHWRWAIGAVAGVLFLSGALWMSESPRWAQARPVPVAHNAR